MPIFDPYASLNTPEQKAARLTAGKLAGAPGGVPSQPPAAAPGMSVGGSGFGQINPPGGIQAPPSGAPIGSAAGIPGALDAAASKGFGAGIKPGGIGPAVPGVPAASMDPLDPQAIRAFIKERGAKQGADPSAIGDPEYWVNRLQEHGGLTDANKDYFGYRIESNPNTGTGYYAERNAGKIPFGGKSAGPGGAAGSALGMGGFGSIFGNSKPENTGVIGNPDEVAASRGQTGATQATNDATGQLQALLAKLMGGQGR